MGLVIAPRKLPQTRLASELGRTAARAAVESGEYVSVRPGVLVPTPRATTRWEQEEARALAAIAASARKLRNGAVFSHASAALLHGLWLAGVPDRPEVTQRYKPNSHGARALTRHCAELPPDAVTTMSHVRVTTIERTIVECARTMHPRDALQVADSGLRALIGTDRSTPSRATQQVAEVRAHLLRMIGSGPGHGRRRARAVVTAADPYSESPRETELRWIAVSRGLPTPTTQLAISTRGGTFYVDIGWRWRVRRADGTEELHLVVLEYDGELKYLPGGGIVHSLEGAAAAMLAEKRREDLIREIPHTSFLRFSKQDMRSYDAVFARILAAVPSPARKNLHPIKELLG